MADFTFSDSTPQKLGGSLSVDKNYLVQILLPDGANPIQPLPNYNFNIDNPFSSQTPPTTFFIQKSINGDFIKFSIEAGNSLWFAFPNIQSGTSYIVRISEN